VTTPRTILENIAEAVHAIANTTARRDDLIRQAVAEGVSGTKSAKAANLSRERIYQIDRYPVEQRLRESPTSRRILGG